MAYGGVDVRRLRISVGVRNVARERVGGAANQGRDKSEEREEEEELGADEDGAVDVLDHALADTLGLLLDNAGDLVADLLLDHVLDDGVRAFLEVLDGLRPCCP